jgi:hypothetical protein
MAESEMVLPFFVAVFFLRVREIFSLTWDRVDMKEGYFNLNACLSVA